MSKLCYCSSGSSFESCCKPFLSGDTYPKSAVALMRSRYSAYSLKNTSYLSNSWLPSKRPEISTLFDGNVTWIGLQIIDYRKGKENDDEGTVEFIARYIQDGTFFEMHENSDFVKYDGRWVYSTGENTLKSREIKRSESCPCNSGKKFKRCCG